ncbi:MAG: hypothetical protein ACR2NN_23105 [Bryobacteraceae bacterium]
MSLGTDEGIYLEGARRISQGQVLYRDIFAFTGPGTFWLIALIFKLSGIAISHARLLLIGDLALITTLTYWLGARLLSRRAALALAFVVFSFETGFVFRLYINHRWDSAALALASIVLVCAGTLQPLRWRFFAAGLLGAAAACITPPIALVAAAVLLWWIGQRDLRSYIWPYLAGFSMVSMLVAGVLWYQGSIPALIDSLW